MYLLGGCVEYAFATLTPLPFICAFVFITAMLAGMNFLFSYRLKLSAGLSRSAGLSKQLSKPVTTHHRVGVVGRCSYATYSAASCD
jgi:hypothetical protein